MAEVVIQQSGGGRRLDAGPTSTLVTVPGAATDGRLGVVEMRIEGGWAGPPDHVHHRIDHVWWVVDGELDVTVDGVRHRVSSGDCVFVPAGVAHGFSTGDTSGARLLQVDTPQSLDGYFDELADAFPAGSTPDPATIGSIMRRHDTHPVSGGQA